MTPIRLVVSDVDGTLVTKDKVLTDAAKGAVRRLKEAGAPKAASGPPPGGSNSTEAAKSPAT